MRLDYYFQTVMTFLFKLLHCKKRKNIFSSFTFVSGIGGACTNDSDCRTIENSLCDGTMCACDNTTVPNAANNKCLKGKTGIR